MVCFRLRDNLSISLISTLEVSMLPTWKSCKVECRIKLFWVKTSKNHDEFDNLDFKAFYNHVRGGANLVGKWLWKTSIHVLGYAFSRNLVKFWLVIFFSTNPKRDKSRLKSKTVHMIWRLSQPFTAFSRLNRPPSVVI